MKQFLYTVLIIMLFTNSQCTKAPTAPEADNPYGLPNATQIGANVFACLMNGKKWISRTGIFYMGADIINDTLSMSGSPKFDNYFADLALEIKSGLKEGNRYNINNTTNTAIYIADSTCFGISSNVIHVKATNGNIILTKYDKINRVVSGIFDFFIPITNCDTIKVTNGRFDIKY